MQMCVDVRNGPDIQREDDHIVGLMSTLVGIKRPSTPASRCPGPRARGGEVERGGECGCASPGASRTRRRAQAMHTLTRVPGAGLALATRRIPGLESKGTPASSLLAKPGSSVKRARRSAGHFEADSRSASRVILRVKPYSSHAEPAKNTMPATFAIGEKPSPMKGNASGESDPVAPAMPA